MSPSGLGGVRQAGAGPGKQERFTSALLHHLTIDLLPGELLRLTAERCAWNRRSESWQQYEQDLEARLAELHGRVHRGAYRAQASRRVYIPKSDGRQRPLGIDSVGRQDCPAGGGHFVILNQIYEVDFRGFSYGFRPGRSASHQALDALNLVGIQRKRVNWILDADIRGFFDHLSHEWMMKFVAHRVADTRILRLIGKWLKAGVSEEGDWSETTAGTPRGSGDLTAFGKNVYLHYVFDLWVETWRQKVARTERWWLSATLTIWWSALSGAMTPGVS